MKNELARVLAIDDDPTVLEMVEQVLGSHFACEVAGDVSVARKSLKSGSFDVVLCDVQMPGKSGFRKWR
jgi:DNA-binding response OmpR family regulator